MYRLIVAHQMMDFLKLELATHVHGPLPFFACPKLKATQFMAL